ncbi:MULTISPECIES: DUF7660 family protein [Pectobacterium]|uniref:DUF7660 family protein n=1 Tax=Pectobacterium TaxID=122277 RepID=UPI000D7390DC|nr:MULTISPECIES: hypothetical protein [Pectobacterium]MBA0219210.1 hypothetical protein [Pectobacterium brasiliense]MBN3072107.1 hypothetical protein [Pectobacterium brasiliense]MBN3170780.1 hypothetical protein [Pectobacterium brasiliense]PXB00199.1 hypothetical protein DMB41_20890 [Pectobacterium carotovorum subsp. carotovorum]
MNDHFHPAMDLVKAPVKNKEDIVKLINFLANDVRKNPNKWENNDLPTYLEAMASWIEDMDGFYKNMNRPEPNIDWAGLADILQAAKIYE